MEDNDKDKNTPSGKCGSMNPPVANTTEGPRILEGPTNMQKKEEKEQKKQKTEYKIAKRQLESAKRIIANAEAREETNSAEQAEKLKWAKETVQSVTEEKLKTLLELSLSEKRDLLKNSKRVRSDESEEASSKKVKKNSNSHSSHKSTTINLDSIPYSEVVKLDMRLCIVDLNSPDWRINIERFQLIEKHIIRQLYNFIVENPRSIGPAYTMNEKLRGHHIISCDSKAAVEFIRFAISNAGELWEGADLKVKELHELPIPIKLFVAIPNVEGDGKDQNKILMTLLKVQNPSLQVEKWRIINQVKLPNSNRLLYTFIIDPDSRNTIEKKDYCIHYGVRRCRVKVTKDQNHGNDEEDLINQLVENMLVEDKEDDEGSKSSLELETSQ